MRRCTIYIYERAVGAGLVLALALVSLCACMEPGHGVAASGVVQPQIRLTPAQQLRFNEYYLASVLRREKEEYDAAYELLERALALNPTAPEALFDMAMLRFSMGGMMDSRSLAVGDSLLRQAVAFAPGNKYYKETLGNLLVSKGQFREAAAVYEELVGQGPASSEMLYRLMRLYEQSQDYEAAIRTISRLEEREGADESLTMEKLQNYLAIEDSAGAVRLVENLCAENPNVSRYKIILGQLYYMRPGREEYGFAIIDSVMAVEPDNYYGQLAYYYYYASQKQDSLAQRQQERIILNPATPSDVRVGMLQQKAAAALTAGGDTLGVLRLMRAALELPQADAALGGLCASFMAANLGMPADSLLPVMDKILEVEPDNSRARLTKLQALLFQDRVEQVLAFCRESQLYCPDVLAFYYFEGMNAMRLDRQDEALAALQQGVKQAADSSDPELVADVYSLLGDLLHEDGRNDEAFAAYDKALQLQPSNVLVLNNYAYFLSLEGKELDKAVEMSRQAVDAEPQNATYLDTYAWCLYSNGEYQQARIYIDEALKYMDAEAGKDVYYDHAGDIYYFCKETAEALVYWKEALRVTEDADLRQKLKRKIQWRKP
ncbi:MAG: tetratricopeptide repeat protein [Alloprevotella sp.]|nr:tetratricopeptide repeat protein [Alloprevotella sp.]